MFSRSFRPGPGGSRRDGVLVDIQPPEGAFGVRPDRFHGFSFLLGGWKRARVSTFSHTRCRAEARRADGPVVGAATLTDALEVPRNRRPPGPGFTLCPEAARRY